MRVLITGGTGFIGGTGARRLLARGDAVVALARSPRGPRAAALSAAGAAIVEGDIRHTQAVARAAQTCDAVLHAAGVPRPASWRTFRAVHIEGTLNVLAAARAAGARRVVVIASQAVLFGGRDLVGVGDDCPYPDRHIDPYSATKAEGEKLALAEHGRCGLEVTSLRPAVVWGRGDTTVLPIMIRLAHSPLGVPMCGDGSNTEATTHIENLADAMIAALDAPTVSGRPCLVLDGFRVGWREFLSRQLQAAGVRPRFGRVPRAAAVPAAWALDRAAGALRLPVPLALFGVRTAMTSREFAPTRARDELGYAPRVGFEDGLRDLATWVHEMGGAASLARGGLPRGPASHR